MAKKICQKSAIGYLVQNKEKRLKNESGIVKYA